LADRTKKTQVDLQQNRLPATIDLHQ
jgi:hypothetical protein